MSTNTSVKRGLVYVDAESRVTLLVPNPWTARIFDQGDMYKNIPVASADIVELVEDNDCIKMCTLKAIRGVTFFDSDDRQVAAHVAVAEALLSDTGKAELMRLLEDAEQTDERPA